MRTIVPILVVALTLSILIDAELTNFHHTRIPTPPKSFGVLERMRGHLEKGVTAAATVENAKKHAEAAKHVKAPNGDEGKKVKEAPNLSKDMQADYDRHVAKSRGFHTQDGHNELHPISERCYGQNSTFYPAIARVNELCDDIPFHLLEDSWYSLSRANATLGRICSSRCAGAVSTLFSIPEFDGCLRSHIVENHRMLMAMCQRRGRENSYCGAEILVSPLLHNPCEDYSVRWNENRCRALAPQCWWNHDESQCGRRFTAQNLDNICTPCFELLQMANVESAAEAHRLCHKEDGQYCLVEIIDTQIGLDVYRNQYGSIQYNSTVLEFMCASRRFEKCARVIGSSEEASNSYAQAVSSYIWCLGNHHRYSWSTEADCVFQFQYSISQAYNIHNRNHFCDRSVTNNGLCAAQNGECLYTAQWGYCSPYCNRSLPLVIHNMSCCLGNLQRENIGYNWRANPADFPIRVNESLIVQQYPYGANYHYLKNCSNSSAAVDQWIGTACYSTLSGSGVAGCTDPLIDSGR